MVGRGVNAEETLGNKDTILVFDEKCGNDAWKTFFIHPLVSFLNLFFLA